MRANTSLKRITGLKVALAVLPVVGVVAWAGELNAAQRPSAENSRSGKAESATWIDDIPGNRVVSCVRGCDNDLECLRGCAAPTLLDEASADEGLARRSWTPEPLLASVIREALENVSLCGERYSGLGREDVEPGIHGICVLAATERFLVRAGWGEKNSSTVPSRARGDDIRRAVELIVTVAEISRLAALDARTARTDGADDGTRAGQEPIQGSESGGQVAAGENDPEPATPPTFSECLDEHDANRKECNQRYGGPNGDTGLLNTCREGAKLRFLTCAKTPAE